MTEMLGRPSVPHLAGSRQRGVHRIAPIAAARHYKLSCSRLRVTISTQAAGATPAATTGGVQQTAQVANPKGGAPFPATVQVPTGAELYQVALKKPLGFTLTEKAGGLIVVDEVQPNGHAAQAGVAMGDVLLATTARATEPGSSQPKLVLLQTKGQSFKTVAAGLRSNTCSQCSIVLLLQRQKS